MNTMTNRLPPSKGIRYVFVDGAGPRVVAGRKCMGTGVVIVDEDGQMLVDASYQHFSELSTNVLAEFMAIEDALRLMVALDEEDPGWNWKIWSDNEYAVDSFKFPEQVRKPHLLAVYEKSMALRKAIDFRVEIDWIPREENTLADRSSKLLFSRIMEHT